MESSVPGSPLDQSHYDGLCQLCRSCQQTAELIQACRDCGLPMDERHEQNEWQRQTAEKIKARFFRGEP